MNNLLKIASLGIVGGALGAQAQAQVYLTTGGSEIAIGDNIGSSYDQLYLDASTGTFAATAAPQYFQDYSFVVGVNSNYVEASPVSITEAVTLNGVTKNITLTGIDYINSSDEIVMDASGPVEFDTNTGTYLVTLEGFDTGPDGGGTVGGTVYASVVQAVPEPFTMVLGASAVGLAFRRRKAAKALAV